MSQSLVFNLRVRFKSFGPLKRLLPSSEMYLDIPLDSTVNDVIDRVLEIGGKEFERLIMNNGKLSGNLIVLVNKTDIDRLDGLDTRLSSGDLVTILPHVQGG
ncbi:MAG: MoaD family protein [Candidatus Lokiarchaeota archaeon]|nr:MoaD family protein [Candidatus Lokiarchaeota archaeon]